LKYFPLVIAVSYFLKFSLYYNIPSKVISLLFMSTPQNLTLLISPIPKKLINLWFPSHTKTKFKNHPLTNSHSRHWRQISTNDKNLSQTLHTIMPHQSSHPPPAFRAPKFRQTYSTIKKKLKTHNSPYELSPLQQHFLLLHI
jgi:hypothetical protein